MRRLFLAALFASAAGTVACVGEGAEPVPHGDGKIFISWTIGGAVPSTTSCSRIDHLDVKLYKDDGTSIVISPVTCALTRFRYDELPEGSTLLRIDAISASGCRLSRGEARIIVGTTLPADPSPTVALAAPGACQ